jgi:hypothetical protein
VIRGGPALGEARQAPVWEVNAVTSAAANRHEKIQCTALQPSAAFAAFFP